MPQGQRYPVPGASCSPALSRAWAAPRLFIASYLDLLFILLCLLQRAVLKGKYFRHPGGSSVWGLKARRPAGPQPRARCLPLHKGCIFFPISNAPLTAIGAGGGQAACMGKWESKYGKICGQLPWGKFLRHSADRHWGLRRPRLHLWDWWHPLHFSPNIPEMHPSGWTDRTTHLHHGEGMGALQTPLPEAGLGHPRAPLVNEPLAISHSSCLPLPRYLGTFNAN